VYDLALSRVGEIRNSLPARRSQATVLASSSYALLALHRRSEAMRRLESASSILHETKDIPAEGLKLDSDAYVVSCAWRTITRQREILIAPSLSTSNCWAESWPLTRKNSMTCETRPSSHFCMKKWLVFIGAPARLRRQTPWKHAG